MGNIAFTALDIVTRIVSSAAAGRIISAAGRAALRAGAKEIARHAANQTATGRPYRSRTRPQSDRT